MREKAIIGIDKTLDLLSLAGSEKISYESSAKNYPKPKTATKPKKTYINMMSTALKPPVDQGKKSSETIIQSSSHSVIPPTVEPVSSKKLEYSSFTTSQDVSQTSSVSAQSQPSLEKQVSADPSLGKFLKADLSFLKQRGNSIIQFAAKAEAMGTRARRVSDSNSSGVPLDTRRITLKKNGMPTAKDMEYLLKVASASGAAMKSERTIVGPMEEEVARIVTAESSQHWTGIYRVYAIAHKLTVLAKKSAFATDKQKEGFQIKTHQSISEYSIEKKGKSRSKDL